MIRRIRAFLSPLRLWATRLWLCFWWLWPIDKNKVVIVSYYGGGFGDNGKAIALKLREKNPDLKIVWPATPANRDKVPEFCQYVPFQSLAYYREMATAAVWVDNARKTGEILKRKGQFYVQTWHGMVPLKRIEKDAADALPDVYIKNAKRDSKMADVMVSGCGFYTKLCRSSFWYDGEILECGSPRLDVLFNQTEKAKCGIRQQIGIPEGKKVILYAPTFRADGNTDHYIRNYDQILAAMEKKTGEEWVFAIRLHPNVAKKAGFVNYSEKLINATVYPDLYDIITISDIVISDYSSLMFDSGLIHKPVFLYATDIEAYRADRGFYFELQDVPFPLARSNEELVQNLMGFDETHYLTELEKFNTMMDYYENGTAAEAVANRILEELK